MNRRDLKDLIPIKTTAVVVIDKQYGYLERTSASTNSLKAKLPDIENFIEYARSKSVPIYWTQMIENKENSPSNLSLVMRRDESYTPLTKPGEQSFEFYGKVRPQDGEIVVVKKYYSWFYCSSATGSGR